MIRSMSYDDKNSILTIVICDKTLYSGMNLLHICKQCFSKQIEIKYEHARALTHLSYSLVVRLEQTITCATPPFFVLSLNL